MGDEKMMMGNCTKCGCVVDVDSENLGDLTGPHPTLRRGDDGGYDNGAVCDHADKGYKAALARVAMLRRADFQHNMGAPVGHTSPEIATILTTLRNRGYGREVAGYERDTDTFDSYRRSIENLSEQAHCYESLARVAKAREAEAAATIARLTPQPRRWETVTADLVRTCGEVTRHGGTTTAPRPGGLRMMLRSAAGLTVVVVFPGAETPFAAAYWPKREGIGLPFVDDGPVYPQPDDTVWLIDESGLPMPWPEGV